MKSLRLILALPLLASTLLLSACKKEETPPQPGGLLNNGNFEQGQQSWFFSKELTNSINPNGYRWGATTETASSPLYSLKITSGEMKQADFCYYGQSNIPFNTIPIGAKLTLKAKIKTALVGPGVAISIRGDKGTTYGVFFASTEDKTPITGTHDFTEYSATLDSFPGGIDNLIVYLAYLGTTSGTVYFDDVSLTVH